MALKKLPGGVIVETTDGARLNEDAGVNLEAIHRQLGAQAAAAMDALKTKADITALNGVRATAQAAQSTALDARTTASAASSVAGSAQTAAGNAVDRVSALESAAGFGPSTPVDGQTASLVLQPDTQTRAAVLGATAAAVDRPENLWRTATLTDLAITTSSFVPQGGYVTGVIPVTAGERLSVSRPAWTNARLVIGFASQMPASGVTPINRQDLSTTGRVLVEGLTVPAGATHMAVFVSLTGTDVCPDLRIEYGPTAHPEDAPVAASLRRATLTTREAPLTPERFAAGRPGARLDHTIALRAMFDMAATARGTAEVHLPEGDWVFRDSDKKGPLRLRSGMTITGDNTLSTFLRATNTSGVALLTWTGHIRGLTIRDLAISVGSGGGHLIAPAPLSGLDRGTFQRVSFVQQLGPYSIWHHPQGRDLIQVEWHGCEFTASAATVPWFNLESTNGGFNSNRFELSRFNGQNNTKAPVFKLTESAHGAHTNDWAWRDCIMEQTTGGIIHAQAAANWVLENVQSWDAQVPHAADLYRFTNGTGGGPVHNLTLRNVTRHGESLASGVNDVYINSGPSNNKATFINVNVTPYTRSSVISAPAVGVEYVNTLGYSAARLSGMGSPEGVASAAVGSTYLRLDGGPGTTLYVKESGTDATGWRAV